MFFVLYNYYYSINLSVDGYKKYNLQSAKSGGEVPIPLQPSDDSDFISNWLVANNVAMTQQASEQFSSDGELDSRAIVGTPNLGVVRTVMSANSQSFNRLESEVSSTEALAPSLSGTQSLVI